MTPCRSEDIPGDDFRGEFGRANSSDKLANRVGDQ